MSSHIPSTPRIISPSPSPRGSFSSSSGSYLGPVTRSIARTNRVTSPPPIHEDRQTPSGGSVSDAEMSRARSRSPLESRRRRLSGLSKPTDGTSKAAEAAVKGRATGHLKPPGYSYWRELSRSPSPLGLIPIHKEWRSFVRGIQLRVHNHLTVACSLTMTQVHKHEIPRKALHVSIGFLVLHFYSRGYQPTHITPFLLSAFLPITCADLLRHRIPAFNAFYIRVLGALMRESEVDSYNGTIFFLAGTYLVLRVFPKDIGVLGVLLLSWCDTAASTFGRLWGRYTPHIRKGKSLAGTAAAMFTGVASAAVFWGYIGPKLGTPFGYDVGVNAFAFKGMLQLPGAVCGYLGWNPETAKVTGGVAVGIASVVAGTVAAAAEAVDLWGWDDNLTIPVLCGVGLWGFLKTFG